MRNAISITMLVAWSAAAQTQLDLRTQAKSVDFSAASSTKPLKTGTVLPSACAAGEVFFNTSAPAGANLYACAPANTWTVQGGINSQNCWADANTNLLKCQDTQGNIYAVVKTASSGSANQWIDYISPSGIPHTSQPTAGAVGAVADPGANGIPYRNGMGTAAAATVDQLSGPFFCQDAGTGSAYQCNLQPAIGAYSTGSTYWFKANTSNSGAATINFNALGPKAITKQAGQALAAGDIKAGQWVLVTYDGANMQMQSQAGSAMQSNQSNAVTAGTQDFSGAAHTLPMKSGALAARPGTCGIGESYFATDAAPGSNIYGCTGANTWTVEGAGEGSGGLTVQNAGATVGARAAINVIPGQGITSVMTDTGSQINMQLALDSAVISTQPEEQSGSSLLCTSHSGSATTYSCSMTPTLSAYTTGQTLNWIPDINGSGGATTLNLDTLGATPVVQSDGTTAPTSTSIAAGHFYHIWYDGASFRLPASSAPIPVTYSAVATYAAGTTVSYQGILYGSLQSSNIGNTPASSPTWWTPVGLFSRQSGDYSASQVTNAVDSTASYSNPAWITGLAWGKITGIPSTFNAGQILGTNVPLLAAGHLQYDGSAFVWDSTAYLTANQNITVSSDCTGSGTTGISLICTKTSGVAFAPSATTDTTNASNISSGTLPHARLPALLSADVPANAANTTGTASNLSGTPALPNGTAAATQSQSDGSTKIATTSYVDTGLAGKAPSASPAFTGVITVGPTLFSATSGVLSPITVSTAGPVAVTATGFYYNNSAGPITYNLPTISSRNTGAQFCFRNAPAKTGAITLQAPPSTYIDYGGTNGTAGGGGGSTGTFVSSGALGDAACVVAVSITQYEAYPSSGGWVNN